MLVQQKLLILFDIIDSDKINNVVYEEVFIFSLFRYFKGVNVSLSISCYLEQDIVSLDGGIYLKIYKQ